MKIQGEQVGMGKEEAAVRFKEISWHSLPGGI
jgi:hypothetical protein